jgi:nucleoside-diphosphate-sugar epimerase
MTPFGDRHVLVAGAAGFVGANLVRTLAASGAEVHALVRRNALPPALGGLDVRLHLCDVADRACVRQAVETAGPEVVFNLVALGPAAVTGDAARAVGANVTGVLHLLEAAASVSARVVHLGSSLEYAAASRPLREIDTLDTASLFGATKAAGTLLCQALAAAGAADVVVLRPFMVYGPWDKPARFVPTALRAALAGSELRLTSPGYRRDWLHVDDLVDACLRAATAPDVAGEVVNVATGLPIGPEDIVRAIEEVTGRPIRTLPGAEPARPWDRPLWIADVSKAERLLGWRPQTSLHAGLRQTYEWLGTLDGAEALVST